MADYNKPTENTSIFNSRFFQKDTADKGSGVPLNSIMLWSGGTSTIPPNFIASSAANTIYIKRSGPVQTFPPVFDNAGATANIAPFSTFDNTTALSSNPLTASGTGTIVYSLVSQSVDTLSFGSSFSVVIRATDDDGLTTDATYYAVVSYPSYSAVNWLNEWASGDIVIEQNGTFNFRFADNTLGISIISDGVDRALTLVSNSLISFTPNFGSIANNVSITFSLVNGSGTTYDFTKQFDVMTLGYNVELPSNKAYLIPSYNSTGENALGSHITTYMSNVSISFVNAEGVNMTYPYVSGGNYNFNTRFYETSSSITYGAKTYSTVENNLWSGAITLTNFLTYVSSNSSNLNKDSQYVMRLQHTNTGVSTDFIDVGLISTNVWEWIFTNWTSSGSYDVASDTFTDNLNGAVSGYNNYLTSASPITLTFGGQTVSPALSWSPNTPSASSYNGTYTLSYSASIASVLYGVQNDTHSNQFVLTITGNPLVWSWTYPSNFSSSMSFDNQANSLLGFLLSHYETEPTASFAGSNQTVVSSWSPSIPDGNTDGVFVYSHTSTATYNGVQYTDNAPQSTTLTITGNLSFDTIKILPAAGAANDYLELSEIQVWVNNVNVASSSTITANTPIATDYGVGSKLTNNKLGVWFHAGSDMYMSQNNASRLLTLQLNQSYKYGDINAIILATLPATGSRFYTHKIELFNGNTNINKTVDLYALTNGNTSMNAWNTTNIKKCFIKLKGSTSSNPNPTLMRGNYIGSGGTAIGTLRINTGDGNYYTEPTGNQPVGLVDGYSAVSQAIIADADDLCYPTNLP